MKTRQDDTHAGIKSAKIIQSAQKQKMGNCVFIAGKRGEFTRNGGWDYSAQSLKVLRVILFQHAENMGAMGVLSSSPLGSCFFESCSGGTPLGLVGFAFEK